MLNQFADICGRGDEKSEVAHELEEMRLGHKTILGILFEDSLWAAGSFSDALLGRSNVERKANRDELTEVDEVAMILVEHAPKELHLGLQVGVAHRVAILAFDEVLEGRELDFVILRKLVKWFSPLQQLVVGVTDDGNAVLSLRETELGPPIRDRLRRVLDSSVARVLVPGLWRFIPSPVLPISSGQSRPRMSSLTTQQRHPRRRHRPAPNGRRHRAQGCGPHGGGGRA
mmetsp:Transcript_107028/g.307897  ORF Transcript_107028/g.307897 Transcript_107028/m.307897 type:complete len:229 (-) Transcript_107028:120-806(-)